MNFAFEIVYYVDVGLLYLYLSLYRLAAARPVLAGVMSDKESHRIRHHLHARSQSSLLCT